MKKGGSIFTVDSYDGEVVQSCEKIQGLSHKRKRRAEHMNASAVYHNGLCAEGFRKPRAFGRYTMT